MAAYKLQACRASLLLVSVGGQVDTVPLPEEDNPWHSAFMKRETDLTNEASAARVVDSTKARFWKIKNPAKRHVYSGKSLTLRYMCSAPFECLTWVPCLAAA